MLARQKRADDVNPCAIIRMMAPVIPQGVWVKMPLATRPMWLTDE